MASPASDVANGKWAKRENVTCWRVYDREQTTTVDLSKTYVDWAGRFRASHELRRAVLLEVVQENQHSKLHQGCEIDRSARQTHIVRSLFAFAFCVRSIARAQRLDESVQSDPSPNAPLARVPA